MLASQASQQYINRTLDARILNSRENTAFSDAARGRAIS